VYFVSFVVKIFNKKLPKRADFGSRVGTRYDHPPVQAGGGVVVVVVVKMIFDGDIRMLLSGPVYPFFGMPEEEIRGNCILNGEFRMCVGK
jgi:hypothetical protein